MSGSGVVSRLKDEAAQAWAIAAKDIRIYYATPPMIMFGLFMPLFMFFSFSVRRGLGPETGIARLLALTSFFTASSAGAVIIPLERRTRTFHRLLAAPVSLVSILLGKVMVGVFFGLAVSLVPLTLGLVFFRLDVANPLLLAVALLLSTCTFSALGLLFASAPAQSPGGIMMPSTLFRWPLMFISGVFIPLNEMTTWVRVISYVSPLTYGQDLMNHAVLGTGVHHPFLGLAGLLLSLGLFLLPALKLHDWSRRLGL